MSDIIRLSRRQALKLFGLSTGALVIGTPVFGRRAENGLGRLNLFISIHEDEKIDIICHRSEMGQGIRTSIAMIIADELEAPWQNIRVVQADGDEIFGDQNTDGSLSITHNWTTFRELGATAREMLIAAASLLTKVEPLKLEARDGFVVHKSTGHKQSFGSLAKIAATISLQSKPTLKASENFKYIGKGVTPVDVRDIVQGKAQYGIDVDLPNLLVASIERAPVIGAKIKRLDFSRAKRTAGVKEIIKLEAQAQSINTDESVAVVAANMWSALHARSQLSIKWDYTNARRESDEDRQKTLRAALTLPGRRIRNDGNVEAAKASFMHFAEYYCPYLAHASMETPCATAFVSPSGCEIWAPIQDPQRLRQTAADFLGIEIGRVTVHVTLIGGAFGRKCQTDFVLEAVALSQKMKRPIKVVFSREDELKHGFYHADSLQQFSAGLGDNGFPVSWVHKSAFPTVQTVFDAKANSHADWELNMGASNMPYDIPHVRVEGICVPSPIRVGWLRSVSNLFHSFASNVFMDELAEKAKIDPIAYRLHLLSKDRVLENDPVEKATNIKLSTKRMASLITKVAEASKWNDAPAKGEYRGFAAHNSFLSYVAAVATVCVIEGQVRVKRVDVGIDCGTVVNPDAVRAQLEGSVVFGLSAALFQKINIDKGEVRQSNFHDFPVARIGDCPDIRVHLIKSDAHPTGVGEPGVPPIAPAIANAIYKATGKRQRNLPLTI